MSAPGVAGIDRPAATATWQVWTTTAHLTVIDGNAVTALAEASALAEDVLADLDRALSRFRSDSDLVRANSRPGRWTTVSPLLVAATEAALSAARETDGLVDPCLGRVMEWIGYDVTFAELCPVHPVGPVPVRPGAWAEIGLRDDSIRVPEGVALDLGATGKAWAADVLASAIHEALGCEVAVSLGGDVRAVRDDPAATWPVLVTEHPDGRGTRQLVDVIGGVATSTITARRWATPDGPRHHLVDPRTGRPVSAAYRTVTALGTTCLGANTASTAALVLGVEAPAWLEHRGVSARLVSATGEVSYTGDWPADDDFGVRA